MIIRFLKQSVLKNLEINIEENLELYRSGTFNFLQDDPSQYFNSKGKIEFDLELLSKISCVTGDLKEPTNSKMMYRAFPIDPYLARDRRLWIYLTHTYLLEYTRQRWPIPEDPKKAVSQIRLHFFGSGNRGLERNNSASRLWWMAHLCDRVKGVSFEEALECFLFKTDVRANIIERPTTSQSINIFSTIIQKLNESFKKDKALFERDPFRDFMKELNLQGGVKLLDILNDTDIAEIVEECI